MDVRPPQNAKAPRRRSIFVRILRTILLAILVAFTIGFVIGTLLRREVDRPVRYMGQTTIEDSRSGLDEATRSAA